ncbi:MAG: hypothetical protein NWF06_08805 [Candidatus Bathyarchaeota archaeon]|nr:hypothetical protein [Candidatus Bathyarchaeum sp.]
MPEEHIEYTVCWINGSLWAKVDGTYPLSKLDLEIQNQSVTNNSTVFTFEGNEVLMLYPTPPGTTNISIKMDETELEWSNYTQSVSDAVHYTAIGDWPVIACTIYPVLDQFTLMIHYEHPVIKKGGYMFLYDLNISPYLSQWSNKSTAHFAINFETEITDLQVVTITTDEAITPVEYTVTNEGKTETVLLQVVSDYSKPLLGDLLITFSSDKQTEQTSSGFLGSSLTTNQAYAIVAVTVIAAAGLSCFVLLRRKNWSENK